MGRAASWDEAIRFVSAELAAVGAATREAIEARLKAPALGGKLRLDPALEIPKSAADHRGPRSLASAAAR